MSRRRVAKRLPVALRGDGTYMTARRDDARVGELAISFCDEKRTGLVLGAGELLVACTLEEESHGTTG